MARKNHKSTIDVLPEEIKKAIAHLRQTKTIDEILEHLWQMDVKVSRSALGRHVHKLDMVAAKMQQSRDIATALVNRFGEQPENQLHRLNIELMQSVVMDVLTNAVPDPETGEIKPIVLDPESVMFLSRSLKDLASAQKTDADRIVKLKQEALKQAATAVEKVGKAKGLTADTVKEIRAAVLGIKE